MRSARWSISRYLGRCISFRQASGQTRTLVIELWSAWSLPKGRWVFLHVVKVVWVVWICGVQGGHWSYLISSNPCFPKILHMLGLLWNLSLSLSFSKVVSCAYLSIINIWCSTESVSMNSFLLEVFSVFVFVCILYICHCHHWSSVGSVCHQLLTTELGHSVC